MKKSRLIHILSTFSKKDVRELDKWLQSPVHNTREDVVALFQYVTGGNRLQKLHLLTKEKVYKKIFPDTPFDDARLRQTIHFTFKQVEEFLIWQELTENTVAAKTTLAGVYRKRGLYQNCDRTLRDLESTQSRQPYRNEQYLRDNYLLQREKYSYYSSIRRTNLNLQETAQALDATYIADKLRQSCLMLAHQAVETKDYDWQLLAEVLQFVEQSDFLTMPAISIYYFGYKAMTEEEEESHFFYLKKEIVTNGHLFPDFEIRNIYLLAINYCIKKMNLGNKAFIQEAFELYKEGMEKQALIENNTISKVTFLNAVINGVLAGAYDWVEHFIDKYQQYLSATVRENTVNYSLGHYYYEKGDYDTSMQYLVQYEYDDIILNMNAKNILAKIYYEKEEYDALESLLNSFATYLQRKKIVGYHKAGFSNLIKLMRKLLRANPYDKSEIKQLKERILATQPLTSSNKKWLVKQVGEI